MRAGLGRKLGLRQPRVSGPLGFCYFRRLPTVLRVDGLRTAIHLNDHELTTEQYEAAKARGEDRRRGPRAESAYYDAGRDRIIVRLTTGVEIGFAPRDAEGLQHATRADPAEIAIEAFGLGIHFPRLDADLHVPALLEGLSGSKSWMAARLGAAGGRVRSSAKAKASRANGQRGGRPRKPVAGEV